VDARKWAPSRSWVDVCKRSVMQAAVKEMRLKNDRRQATEQIVDENTLGHGTENGHIERTERVRIVIKRQRMRKKAGNRYGLWLRVTGSGYRSQTHTGSIAG